MRKRAENRISGSHTVHYGTQHEREQASWVSASVLSTVTLKVKAMTACSVKEGHGHSRAGGGRRERRAKAGRTSGCGLCQEESGGSIWERFPPSLSKSKHLCRQFLTSAAESPTGPSTCHPSASDPTSDPPCLLPGSAQQSPRFSPLLWPC